MVIFVILLSIVISYIYYRRTKPELDFKRRILLAALRAIAISFVFILLFNPVLTLENTSTSGSKVIVLNDVSDSMNETLANGSKKAVFKDFSDALNKQFSKKTQTFDFAENLRNHNDSIRTTDSKLISSVRKLLKIYNHELIQEIVLVSDGWFHDNDFSSIEKLNIPVSVCIPEIKTDVNDLSLTSVISNKKGFENEDQIISISGRLNEYEGPYNIEIFIDGSSKVTKKYKFLSTDFTHEINIGGLRKGKHKISAMVAFGENISDTLRDVNPDNNRKYASINILDSKKTILCLADYPDNDLRFIKNAVLTDEHLDFRFLLSKSGNFYSGNSRITLDNELIDNISTLIIVNHGKMKISAENSRKIITFLKRNKGLIFIGDPDCGLNEILTQEYDGFPDNLSDQIKVSRSGRKIRIFDALETIQNQLPPFKKIHLKPDAAKKALAVFDDGENSPAIISGSYSGSRIIQFAVQDIWKWSMHSDDPDGYKEFIIGCIKWTGLNENDLINIDMDKDVYFKGDNARITLTAYNESMEKVNDVSAEIFLSKDGKLTARDFFRTSANGEFEYIADLDMAGEYSYRVVDQKSKREKSGKIVVADVSSEAMDSGVNSNLLKYLANITGGSVFSNPADMKLTDSFSISNKEIKEISLYNNLYFLLTFLSAFCLELYLRKRWGLI